ncbi:MAG: hypothetical protein [Caudoviricetes sp.]|nr:MAG: hypothetical protein [Caudoviricetes sp.]
MKTAHHFASKSEKFLVIGENGKFNHENQKVVVSGKREASELAEQLKAKPWNF